MFVEGLPRCRPGRTTRTQIARQLHGQNRTRDRETGQPDDTLTAWPWPASSRSDRGCAADADAITDVQVASWRAGYAHVFPESVLYADDFDSSRRTFWTQLAIRSRPSHRRRHSSRREGEARPIGFCSYGPERERARGHTGRGEVWAFYLHPDYWGSGAADR